MLIEGRTVRGLAENCGGMGGWEGFRPDEWDPRRRETLMLLLGKH